MSDAPIRLGSSLFTLVEPHRGHEVAYNRWYERDHFYAGCMIGPYCFAGRRFVATRDLKALRYPASSSVIPDQEVGSFLSLYWLLDGHHDDWNRWAVDQVNLLHARGRMFAERDHIHTLLYRYQGAVAATGQGVPPELALDHPFPGLVTVFGTLAAGADSGQLHDAAAGVRDGVGALVLTFSPLPLLGDAPSDVPRSAEQPGRFLQLWFTPDHPRAAWETGFGSLGKRFDGLAELDLVAPFVPTIPGTDTYTDELW
jgi:hypothetical protein